MHSRPQLPDFDTLMHMFQDSPKNYETFRKRLLDEAVNECPAQHRHNMQYILMRIEIARQSASTPLDALVFATQLMRESLDELSDQLQQLQYELTNLQSLLVLERIKSYS